MNNKKKSMKKRILIAAACLAMLVAGIPTAVAFASDGLLSPSSTQVTAGSGLEFKVDLSDVKDTYGDQAFTLTINIDPSPESVSVSGGVNVYKNLVSGNITVSSADLGDVTALTFTVYPGSSITESTTYTVSASISGSLDTPSDSFTFTAVPAQTNDNNNADSNTNSTAAKGSMSKGLSGAAKASSGSSGTSSSSDSSTTYQGSADNYLKKLSVSGYDFTQKFNKTRDTYYVNVPESVTSLKVSATPSDSSADVKIAGNGNISEDMSKIMINVTADNGDVRTYRIYVTHNAE